MEGGGGIRIIPLSSNNKIRNIRIQGNILNKAKDLGISLVAADVSSHWMDPNLRPVRFSDNNSIIDVKIYNNVIKNTFNAISIACAGYDNRNNTVQKIKIKNNTLDGGLVGFDGISFACAGLPGEIRTMRDNVIEDVKVINNRIRNNRRFGINIINGERPSEKSFAYKGKSVLKNEYKNMLFRKNVIENYTRAGLYIVAAVSGSKNQLDGLIIKQNTFTGSLANDPGSSAVGIQVYGGIANIEEKRCIFGINSKQNVIKNLVLEQNHFKENHFAIHLIGGDGQGADKNKISSVIQGNTYISNVDSLVIEENSAGAQNNSVNVNNMN